MKNVRATSRDRPRQAYLGASRIRAAGTRISSALAGRRRGYQLDQRGQAARDADRFGRAQHDLAVLDHQRVAFAGRVAAVRREAGRRGQPARFVRGGQLDRDGRLIRYPVAGAGARRKPVRRAICAQNRPTSGAIGVSAYATAVPGRKANPGPSPASNRAGAGMTA